MLGLRIDTSTWVLVFFSSSPDIDKSMKVLLLRLVSAVEGEMPTGFSMTAISSEEVCLFLDPSQIVDFIDTIDFCDDPLI